MWKKFKTKCEKSSKQNVKKVQNKMWKKLKTNCEKSSKQNVKKVQKINNHSFNKNNFKKVKKNQLLIKKVAFKEQESDTESVSSYSSDCTTSTKTESTRRSTNSQFDIDEMPDVPGLENTKYPVKYCENLEKNF